jgi:hypothetical protein
VDLDSDDITVRRSGLLRYRSHITDSERRITAVADRERLPNLCLFDWIQSWNWQTWKPRPRASPKVINYYPRYLNHPDSPAFTDNYRVKLMLHHPFTEYDNLLTVDGTTYDSYTAAFRACKGSHSHSPDY